MKSIDEQKELFTKILDMLEQHFGQSCEIVLHDLTREYDHTIVDIRNGHITGRKVGDCGSNLGLEVLRGTVVNGDRFNYISHTTDAKILRSSSIYFHDDQQRTIGSICINTDITESVRCRPTRSRKSSRRMSSSCWSISSRKGSGWWANRPRSWTRRTAISFCSTWMPTARF